VDVEDRRSIGGILVNSLFDREQHVVALADARDIAKIVVEARL
jgi:hypothetical protein